MSTWSRRCGPAVAALLSATVATAAKCQPDARATARDTASARLAGSAVVFAPATVSDEEQRRVLMRAARTAWNFVRRNYSGSSGLVRALDSWQYVTIWDVASALAAYHSAHGLGLINDGDYRRRMTQALRTLERMPLYQDAAFNKQYASSSGRMVDRDQKASRTGYGWSAIDLGRILVWLKIIAENDPAAAPTAERIARRMKFERLLRDGYLVGANTEPKYNTHYEYQEGRVGYEQYAAEGFALWGARAEKALDFHANGKPVDVLGFQVLADARGNDLLTSEPFILMGMELGWTNPTWEGQARNVLAAQRERFRRTGTMTMLSEDAIPVAPAFFYYYLLHHNGMDFVVGAPGGPPHGSYPRWVSTKAAFGWHALFPTDYTWDAIQVIQPAGRSGRGWTAGVYEKSKRATPRANLNTAAIVLEAVYVAQRGCPLIRRVCGAHER